MSILSEFLTMQFAFCVSPVCLTEKEAAEYIGMSRSFLRQDRMHGFRAIIHQELVLFVRRNVSL